MSGQATGLAKGLKVATEEQRKHLIDKHLKVSIDENEHEIRYGADCRKEGCPIPGKTKKVFFRTEGNIESGEEAGLAKGHTKTTEEQRKHLIDEHLQFFIDENEHVVEIRHGVDCAKPGGCSTPRRPKTVVFRSCPTAPCNP